MSFQGLDHLSPALEVLIPGHLADALGGEHSIEADFPEEMRGTHSEQVAEFFDGEDVQVLELLSNALEVGGAVLMRVVGQDAFFVDVFPSTFEVDQSNSVIENGLNLLNLRIIFVEPKNCFLHKFLRFLVIAEVGVKLVDKIRLAILLSALQLLLLISVPRLLDLALAGKRCGHIFDGGFGVGESLGEVQKRDALKGGIIVIMKVI